MKDNQNSIPSFLFAGSQFVHLREARRLRRLQRIQTSPTISEDSPSPPPQPVVDKHAQSRVIIEIAWKTVALMQKNKIIQQKIVALQKETLEFIAKFTKTPQVRMSTPLMHSCTPAQMQLKETHLSLEVTPNV